MHEAIHKSTCNDLVFILVHANCDVRSVPEVCKLPPAKRIAYEHFFFSEINLFNAEVTKVYERRPSLLWRSVGEYCDVAMKVLISTKKKDV